MGRLSLLTSAATINSVVTNLLRHVEESIRARKLLARRQRILVAVSGGLDSMTLLHLLHKLAPSRGWKLSVAHLNHQLRGRASDADERFVRSLCARLRLPCVLERADVRAQAKARGLSIEMAGREVRHEFLACTARRLRISTIALAHHADDQVELFFLRLLRGTGPDGLAGMKWHAPSPCDNLVQLIRPLLEVGRTELKQFARENKIRFREDESNASRDILRNRLRHELLPRLRGRYQPALNQLVLRLMDIVSAESELLSETARWLGENRRRGSFASLPIALQRRLLLQQLQLHKVATNFDLVEQLRGAANQPVSVGAQLSVSRDQRGLVRLHTHRPSPFNPNQVAVSLEGRAGEIVFDGVHFQWRFEAAKRGGVPRRRRGCEFFDGAAAGEQIVLRHWRTGDRFRPIGMRAELKLQDWFTNQKIPRALRRELIVATTASGKIFWIENQRIGERFKLGPRTTRRLIWRWKRL